METTIVEYTSEHYLFLWQRFRHIDPSSFHKNWSPEALAKEKNLICAEIRENGFLIATGIGYDGYLGLSAASESHTGLQKPLIKARLEKFKELGYESVNVDVRSCNYRSLKNLLDLGFKVSGTFRYANDDLGFSMDYKFPKEVEQTEEPKTK